MYNCDYKIVELQSKCKELKISYGGRKADLVKRLNNALKEKNQEDVADKNNEDDDDDELTEVAIRAFSDNIGKDKDFEIEDDDDTSSNDDDDAESINSKSDGKRIRYIYSKSDEFENHDLALIKLDEDWSFERRRVSKNNANIKEFFYCKKGHKCKSKVYIYLSQEDDSVSIWSNNLEHDHSVEKIQLGINSITKKQIDTLVRSSVNTATRIKNALRDKIDPYLPKKKQSDPDIENTLYIPGIEIPTVLQINNYLNNTLRPKLHGARNFSYADLFNWVNENKSVPDNDDEPFVIDSYIHLNERVVNASIIRISISTRNLMRLAMKTAHCCADATYKLIWHNFPVFLIGTTDSQKIFHPFSISICTNETHIDFAFIFGALRNALSENFSYVYRPTVLIADGAESITNGFQEALNYNSTIEFTRVMCWAHVYRAIETKTKSIENESRIEIRSDIDFLQISSSPELFKAAYELFEKKWSKLNVDAINSFLQYFKKEWIESRNNNWFEGAAVNIPSTDNGLESINGKIKSIYTLRSRMAVNVYLSNAVNMLRNWSKDTLKDKPFKDDYKVTKESWSCAFQCLVNGTTVIQKIGKLDNYVFCKNKDDASLINKDFINNRFEKLENLEFDHLIKLMLKIKKIRLDRTSWTKSSCSCGFFFKNYFCYHIIVVAVNENLTEIPLQFKKSAIVPKAKVGRKPKAKDALTRQ